jgi:hypothetical protein
MENNYNELQQVKRRFFALRNGALGELMRRQGATYRIIFGLNLPQLTEIAASTPVSAQLAQKLWDNTTTRESMLLAPMIYPVDEFSFDTALAWTASAPTAEVADILCHKLLRRCSFALSLAQELSQSDNDMQRYIALRLHFNLLPNGIDTAEAMAAAELARNCPLTATLSRSLLSEIEFLKEA